MPRVGPTCRGWRPMRWRVSVRRSHEYSFVRRAVDPPKLRAESSSFAQAPRGRAYSTTSSLVWTRLTLRETK